VEVVEGVETVLEARELVAVEVLLAINLEVSQHLDKDSLVD
jgi:hypothetical protein